MRYSIGSCLIIVSLTIGHSLGTKPAPNPKIVIVGAGVSGIAAAVHLVDYGFTDITLLEAEPRIGGRIHTIKFAENVVDLGAEYCHGERANDVYDLAYKTGILEHPDKNFMNITYVRSNAEILPAELVEKLAKIIAKHEEEYNEQAKDYVGSIGSLLREKFNKLLSSTEYKDIDKVIAKEYLDVYEKMESINEGSDNLDTVSARDDVLFDTIEGDYFMHFKDKGYKEFLRLLLKSEETGKEHGILDGLVKLSKKVKYIQWQRDDYKTLVKCEDGEEILADHVIVTVSLGVLKDNADSMFEPPLPAEKQKLIKTLAFGSFNKIFLEFPSRFWAKNSRGTCFLWREEDLKSIRSSNQTWLEGIFCFLALPYQPNVLEGWVVGASAREIENMPLKDIETGALKILKQFFGSTINIPAPINVMVSKWFTNPNFRGCYSYHSLETEKADISNQFLANTLHGVCDLENYQDLCEKPVLQFAGEATESRHFATVHGALETGYREAQKIHDYYVYGPKSVRDQYYMKE